MSFQIKGGVRISEGSLLWELHALSLYKPLFIMIESVDSKKHN